MRLGGLVYFTSGSKVLGDLTVFLATKLVLLVLGSDLGVEPAATPPRLGLVGLLTGILLDFLRPFSHQRLTIARRQPFAAGIEKYYLIINSIGQ